MLGKFPLEELFSQRLWIGLMLRGYVHIIRKISLAKQDLALFNRDPDKTSCFFSEQPLSARHI